MFNLHAWINLQITCREMEEEEVKKQGDGGLEYSKIRR